MNSTEENNEVVYDVTQIEELIMDDEGPPVLEIAAHEINVMEYIDSSDIPHKNGNKSGKRQNSGRIVHLAHEEPGMSEQKNFMESPKNYMEESISEVIVGPTTSASRIFVTSEQAGQHMGLPVFSNNAEHFNTAAQLIATGALGVNYSVKKQILQISPSQICPQTPQEFTGTGTFLVDISCYSNRMEAGFDGLGPWGLPQNSSKYYNIRDGNQLISASSSCYGWKILCSRYIHPGTDSRGIFHKKIYTGFRQTGIPSSLAVIVYEWVGEPHAISVSSSSIQHSMRVKSFGHRVWESRLEDIYRDDNLSYRDHPVFSRVCVDFETACRILHEHSNIPLERICKRNPQHFRECGTFVLDIAACGGDRQLCRDGREWNKPSGSSRFFQIDGDGNAIRIDASNVHSGNHFDIQVMLKRYESSDPNGLTRKIYISRDKLRRLVSPIAVVTYIYRPTMPVKNPRPVVHIENPKKRPFPNEQGNPFNGEMYEMRKKTLELQMDNQTRFSSLLDRAEAFLERFEQTGTPMPVTRQLVQAWRGAPE